MLETGGKSIGFEAISNAKEAKCFESLRLNKKLKLVNTTPHFQSVPATAHLFDLAGAGISYPEAEEVKGEQKAGWFGGFGGWLGRK